MVLRMQNHKVRGLLRRDDLIYKDVSMAVFLLILKDGKLQSESTH